MLCRICPVMSRVTDAHHCKLSRLEILWFLFHILQESSGGVGRHQYIGTSCHGWVSWISYVTLLSCKWMFLFWSQMARNTFSAECNRVSVDYNSLLALASLTRQVSKSTSHRAISCALLQYSYNCPSSWSDQECKCFLKATRQSTILWSQTDRQALSILKVGLAPCKEWWKWHDASPYYSAEHVQGVSKRLLCFTLT